MGSPDEHHGRAALMTGTDRSTDRSVNRSNDRSNDGSLSAAEINAAGSAMVAAQPLDIFGCTLAGTHLVEASAGTGKTWAICGLVLRLLIERQLAVQEVLVVTFTKAATAELRDRVRSRIAQTLARLRGTGGTAGRGSTDGTDGTGGMGGMGGMGSTGGHAGDDPFVEQLLNAERARGMSDIDMALRLDLALQSFDEAAIFTIHGFCQRALTDAALSAAEPLQQTLQDDLSELRLQVVHDFWRRHLSTDAAPPGLAAHCLARRDTPQSHAELLQRRMAKPLALLRWPADIDNTAGPDVAELAQAHEDAGLCWQQERGAVLQAVQQAWPGLNKTRFKDSTLNACVTLWDKLLNQTNPLAESGDDKGDYRLWLLTPDSLEPTKTSGAKPITPHPFFGLAEQLLTLRGPAQTAVARQRLRLLRSLLTEGPVAMQQAQKEARVWGYDDLLFKLRQRLYGDGGPALVQGLRGRFQAALIDEFQDTDPLQFDIFQRLFMHAGDSPQDATPLFLVGDPKQAIYSFRNADLHTYLNARGSASQHHSLAHNQRSVPRLVGALNALFGNNPRAFLLPGLDYRAVEVGDKPRAVLFDADGEAAPLQLWGLPHAVEAVAVAAEALTAATAATAVPEVDAGTEAAADRQPWPKAEARLRAAAATAAEIAQLLARAARGDLRLGDRPVAAADIAVLVRSHAQGALVRQALARLNVVAVELSQASVFKSLEAEELQRVLAAVLQPQREPLVRAALATELLGWDAAAIQTLADDDTLLLRQVQALSQLRTSWSQRGVGVMLRQLTAQFGVTARLLARADGERRLTNLRHLGELLQQAAADRASGPSNAQALLRWLTERRADGGSDREAAQLRLESDRNLVQIITIHKSKGLEYPFVFCPFLWDGHLGGSRRSAGMQEWFDEEAQCTVLDLRGLDKKDESGPAIAQAQRKAASAENLRLVYVALTRAVQRCYVVVGPYTSGKNRSTEESAGSPLQWLIRTPQGEQVAQGQQPPQGQPPPTGGLPQQDEQPPTAEPGPKARSTGRTERTQRSTPAAEQASVWLAFAQANAESVSWAPLRQAAGVPMPSARPAPDSISAWPTPPPVPGAWRMGSYSSLSQGAAGAPAANATEPLAADHDTRLLPAEPSAADADAATTTSDAATPDILAFPRGAAAGECLHAVFENIDFCDPDTWPAATAHALAALPQATPPLRPLLSAQVQRMLGDVLNTRLWPTAHPGLALATITPAQRLVELEFTLPAPHLQAGTLTALLRRAGYPVPELGFGALRGYLRGFIDLVFEHEGRYFVLDWKSNHLGDTAAHYAAPRLQAAMDHQGYHLQYLLYTVALHRWLGQRLAGYDFEQHFGGVLYLFVRGVRPAWADASGAPCGVFAHRPTLALVRALSALLEGTEPLAKVEQAAVDAA